MRQGSIVICRGPRATQARVVEHLEALVPRSLSAHELAQPVLVVVATTLQRERLAAELGRRNGACAGIRILTLWGLARWLLERAGEVGEPADELFEVLARRAARAQPQLAELVRRFEDFDRRAAASMRDLLDAGPLAKVKGDGLAPLAQEVLLAASATEKELARAGVRTRGLLLRAAARCPLPARAVLVHGFSDATGSQLALLRALLAAGATVYVDEPADAAQPRQATRAAGFVQRFVGLLQTGRVQRDGRTEPQTKLEYFSAPGIEAEAREALQRVRALCDSGVAPEEIALVAPAIGDYASRLVEWCERLGVPCSGAPVASGLAPGWRRRRAALRLFTLRGSALLEDWHAAFARPGRELAQWRRHAVALVQDAAALELQGLEASAQAMRAWLARIDELCTGRRNLAAWLQELDPPCGEPLQALAETFPAGVDLGYDEALTLFARAWREDAAVPVGGEGGGVQLLDVHRARGLVHTHLFVLGLNQDTLPQAPAEDPLLADADRLRLAEQLPALAPRQLALVEHRLRFDQLCGAACTVTLSWQHSSENGKELLRSPYVDELRPPPEVERVPRDSAGRLARDLQQGRRLDREDALLLTALRGDRGQWERMLGLVLPAPLASARIAVLRAFDPPQPVAGIGPWSGCLGTVPLAASRFDKLNVTDLERYAVCPWLKFLEKSLRVAPRGDPLLELPQLSPKLLGSTVHRTLERLLAEHLGEEAPDGLAEALARGPVQVPLPEAGHVAEVLAEEARKAASEDGIHLRGLQDALIQRALPCVQRALEGDWTLPLLGVEIEGTATFGEGAGRRAVHFRADRAQLREGELLLTDFKTGAAAKDARLDDDIARGRRLQVAAYALCDGAGERPRAGRYEFLGSEDRAQGTLERPGDDELRDRAGAAIQVLASALEAGIFVPRVELPGSGNDPDACEYCRYREACIRGDSGQRRRLVRAAEDAEGPLGRLWRLPEAKA
jgi:hypothetical protein